MEISILRQAVSFAAAMLILVAYVGHQMNWMDSRKASYNLLNAAGSAVLAYIALRPFQAGFVVLEGTWAAISIFAWVRGWQQASKPS